MNVFNLSDAEALYLGKRIEEAEHRKAVEQEIAERRTCLKCKKRHAPKHGLQWCKPCKQGRGG